MAREISEIKTQLQSSEATSPAAGSAMDGQTCIIGGKNVYTFCEQTRITRSFFIHAPTH